MWAKLGESIRCPWVGWWWVCYETPRAVDILSSPQFRLHQDSPLWRQANSPFDIHNLTEKNRGLWTAYMWYRSSWENFHFGWWQVASLHKSMWHGKRDTPWKASIVASPLVWVFCRSGLTILRFGNGYLCGQGKRLVILTYFVLVHKGSDSNHQCQFYAPNQERIVPSSVYSKWWATEGWHSLDHRDGEVTMWQTFLYINWQVWDPVFLWVWNRFLRNFTYLLNLVW